ncbi:MAG: hypothetical protein PHQ77_10305 [Proteiniphilum sp.]|nr:hypothetical protein [Proteiniphilum sp.]
MKELPEISIDQFQLAVLPDEEACRFRRSGSLTHRSSCGTWPPRWTR